MDTQPDLQNDNINIMTKQYWDKLDHWINQHQWAGYDPYDLKGLRWHHFFTALQSSKLLRIFSSIVIGSLENHWPQFTRRLARVKPCVNANTVALLARSYLAVSRTLEQYDEVLLDKIKNCFKWLLENSSLPIESGKLGWGYHFTWYAGHGGQTCLQPNTPLSVVTSEVGHAFLDCYDLFHIESDLNAAAACGRMFMENLNIDEIDKNKVCFSYSTQDNFHVINANLNVAAYLTRLSKYTNNLKMLTLARRARCYSASLQNGDGSWFYWGPQDYRSGAYYNIDCYHTGMVLQWLDLCQQYDYSADYDAILNRGVDFYLAYLFDNNGAPRKTPLSRYPRDIHAVAQSLITLSSLATRWDEAKNILYKVLEWGTQHMSNPDGSFAYRVYSDRVDRMPYMRWGQAWMFWGLACTYEHLTKINSPIKD